MYGARDISSMSSFVIASVTERSIFHALHIHTPAKSTISIIESVDSISRDGPDMPYM